MTRPASGGTERGTRAPSRSTGMRGAVGAVVIVLALGLALRLIIAYLLPGSGFGVDLTSFRYWASNLADQGPWGFYGRDFFHDYTPGYLYVLWLVGLVGKVFGGVGDLIKIPPVLADLAIGWLVHSMILELGGRRRLALVGAFVAVMNPISWFDSVVWGQVDSFGVVFLLLGLRELWRDHPERSAVYAVIAAIIKPQLGILIPLVAIVTIRRALRPAGGEGDEDRTGRPMRIVTTGLAGFVTAVLLAIPFGLTPIGLIEQIAIAGGGYPYLSVNAYNPWALVSSDTGVSLASTGQWVCDAALGGATSAARAALSLASCPRSRSGRRFWWGPSWSYCGSSGGGPTGSRCSSGSRCSRSRSSCSRHASTNGMATRSSRSASSWPRSRPAGEWRMRPSASRRSRTCTSS